MHISDLNQSRILPHTNTIKTVVKRHYSTFKLLENDSASFKGKTLKKSDFTGLDLAIIEKYNPNIQKFKTKECLQTWAANETKKLINRDYKGRTKTSQKHRNTILGQWIEHLKTNSNCFTDTQKLVIMHAVTKDLKDNNDTLPLFLIEKVLEKSINELSERLKDNPKQAFDFNKIYIKNIQEYYLNEYNEINKGKKWLNIPSRNTDPINYKDNVEILKAFSHKSWCTKTYKAEETLKKGSMHILLINGEPKLGIRFEGEDIVEVQGELNNSKIPIKYFDEFKSYVEKEKFNIDTSIQKIIERTEKIKEETNKIREKLGVSIELRTIEDAIKVLNILGKKVEKGSSNKLVIEDYNGHTDDWYSYYDIGINENTLFKYIEKIKGNADFTDSNISSLGSLKQIGGNGDFRYSAIKTLGNLEHVGGNAHFLNSEITNLGNLKYIGGYCNIVGSKLKTQDFAKVTVDKEIKSIPISGCIL